ncbi:O-antigen ligase family protein [Candidatus Roizmanbacteria bacterium]|nr:O-antigen ligase family protein [Candidatus Roizmanbacteria bacterium]
MIDQIIQFFYSLLFFVTPIFMSKDTSELFEFNKMLFIYVATVLIAFFWLLKMVVHKKIILKKTPLDIPIIFFFLSQLISTIFSLDRHTSIFGYYGRFNGGLISTLSYIILYFAFVSNNLNVEKTLKAILASSLLVILWAIPGKFGHDLTCLVFTGQFNNSCWDNTTLAFRPELRAFSTLGQPNWLGAYLSVTFFIGVYFLISQKLNSKVKSLIWPAYLFLNFSVILFSRSRSAIFAVLIGLIIFIGYYLLFVKINLKRILIVLLVVIIIPILFFKTGEDKIDKYLSISNIKYQRSKINVPKTSPSSSINNQTSNNVTESFDIRKIVWQGAWELALKYPLFGTGVETFAYSYGFVRPVAHNLTSEWDYVYNKAHNEYFNFLATTGFVGLGSYLLMIIFVVAYGIKNYKKSLTPLLIISYITILITNFFGFSTTTIQLFFYLIPALVIMGNRQQTETTKFEKINAYQWLAIFVLTTTAIYLLFSITIYYLADVNYSYGLKYLKPKTLDYQKAASFFEKALKLRQEPFYEDKFSSSLAYISALAAFQKQNDLAKQIASIADSYNRKTIQNYPKNVFYWKTRVKNMYYFYQVTGNDNELLQGVEALKTARDLYPTDPKIPYSLALYYSTLYDSTKNNLDKQNFQKLSLEEIDKSIRLKSNYQEAYSLKGQLLKKYGQYKDGP